MEIEREENFGNDSKEKREFISSLYYEYERMMFATVKRYIDDRIEQEDVVQESLKKLIEKQERLSKLARAAQAEYVAVTVRNTAISFLREKSKGKNKILSLDALGEEVLNRYMTSVEEDVLIQQKMVRRLKEGLENLPPQDRALLEGKYILEQSDKELAVNFKCKPESIRMKLTRARRKLLDIIKRGEEDDES